MERELRILMLEDLEEDIGLIEHSLRKEGLHFTSRAADTREQFVLALNEFEPDVILSDHALPQFNSVEALKICRKGGSNIPFILVTGTVSEEFAVSCLKQGADDYVLKSNLARLYSAITNALKQRNIEVKRKKAEKALRRQNEELVKINNELDSFVYSVSHNLRAPLMSVLGLVRLAHEDDKKFGNRLHEYFGMMEHSINKLDETLKEILDYSRNARMEIVVEKVDMRKQVEDGIERLKYHEGSEQIQKIIVIREKFPLYTDGHRVAVVLNNLISNSIKYRDPHKEHQFIKIEMHIDQTTATLYFSDNGIGISDEWQAKVFDMFFRATERSEGAGLGLYIVKEAVEKLGGKIQVQSKVDEGTTFIITLPNHLREIESQEQPRLIQS
ncbi:sensor histidine kinase [Pseudochryseolinea flava]|uniref:histidine kinase n=1 Tax=Pseudochryseolinea flava TaxID=2059302 RepID=A0A364Y4A4_9BACT|nr:hybrid sensor histidine kinase/response regulator [Pseudochryseolinea flava]RAW01184.1 hybrid sensor histidine kinase/response regulator [Pseudochryseolinea flava]